MQNVKIPKPMLTPADARDHENEFASHGDT